MYPIHMPAKEKYTRIHRLLQIISLIQAQRGWTAKELSDECDVDIRTIHRDIREIKGAGIPIISGTGDEGYRINGSFFMPPVRLTFEEALAVATLCETASDIPFAKPAGMAINKILSQLPFDVKNDLIERLNNMQLRTAATMDEGGYEDVYDRVQNALLHHTMLKCKYESASSTNSEEPFFFHPYALFFGTRAWYVVGFHEGRDAIRTLKLSRFVALEETNLKYDLPKFNLDQHLGNAWNMIAGDKEYEIELHFKPPFSQTVSDTVWHPTQEITWNDDESCIFTCTVSGLEEIVWWVLSMGPYCKVSKPYELAQRIKNLSIETADTYK